MRLYESIKYAASKGVGLSIIYDSKKDYIRLIASKTDGVCLYQKEMTMFGTPSIDPRPGDLLFENVKKLVDDLSFKVL